ncbi:hypothetical protein V5O48_004701 [Marasmius crinis-equi]|uniref:SMP-LTD domain-containing protein n=1 Tax=Marasmius crinis-equi TaxID=585013 RepID=A0ABR3FPE3_9AGAR
MSLKTILYVYVFGGVTFVPLLLAIFAWYAWHTAVPIQDVQENRTKQVLPEVADESEDQQLNASDLGDLPKTRKGWLTVRRTFEEPTVEGGYVNLMRSFLDARSKDPKRSRPKDMWFVVLKGKILYLYEDEGMTECEAVIQLGGHDVVIFPENLMDGELFTRRNAICLKPKNKISKEEETGMPSLSKEMKLGDTEADATAHVENSALPDPSLSAKKREKERERRIEQEKGKIAAAREEALEPSTPWFIFIRSPFEMEDWYLAMIHASDNPPQTPILKPLQSVYLPSDMNILVSKLDEQPDVIPMRWFNALLGRIIFSFYRTQHLESFIIGRLMKKISKVKRPAFLPSVVVTEVSVGNRTPLFSKPMLKELTKEGDASMEVHLQYKGEIRITIEATAILSVPLSKATYTVKVALAAILKEIEGNMLIKVKRPPSNRIWYAFTQMPKIVLEVEPIVSDRQITWGMILSTIESQIKAIIQESVVLPNMDDISFFETADYGHRGGIWADAARVAKFSPQPGLPSESATAEPSPGETVAASEEFVPSAISKTQTVTSTTSEPAHPSTSALSSSPEDSNGSTSVNRRKTWFSSMRGSDSNGLKDQPESDGDEHQRGRTTESDESSQPPRSQSTPRKAELMPEEIPGGSAQDEAEDRNSLHPIQRRSSSRRSSARIEGFDIPTPTSHETSPTPPVRTSTTTSIPNTPTSPSSFLTALKNKTADKQALSNSAKEAMKKWGVNWGNLRKDSSSTSSSGQNNEDLADHDSVSSGLSRTRTTSSVGSGSSNSNIAQKARASYAEVRAAVAERRGRQQASGSPDPASDNDHLSTSTARTSSRTSTSPSPEPATRNNTDSELAPPPELYATPVRKTSSASSTHGYMDTPDVERDRPNPQAVPMSRQPTRSSQHSGMGIGSPPVYSVQPQAKTMSIPGIHASHKGEVMSMGYVAPPQHPPANSSDGASSSPETKSKVLTSLGGSAGIQSVYRLFSKNQGQGSQNAQTAEGEGEPRQAQAQTGDSDEQGQDEASPERLLATATPANSDPGPAPATPLRKRTPPPIPPRARILSVPGAAPPSISPVSRSPAPSLPPRASPAGRKSFETSTPSVSVSPGSSASPLATAAGASGPDDQPSAASEHLKLIAKRASLSGAKDKDHKEASLSSSSVDSVGVTA